MWSYTYTPRNLPYTKKNTHTKKNVSLPIAQQSAKENIDAIQLVLRSVYFGANNPSKPVNCSPSGGLAWALSKGQIGVAFAYQCQMTGQR